jgi:hypothetical protein
MANRFPSKYVDPWLHFLRTDNRQLILEAHGVR